MAIGKKFCLIERRILMQIEESTESTKKYKRKTTMKTTAENLRKNNKIKRQSEADIIKSAECNSYDEFLKSIRRRVNLKEEG